MQSFTHITQDDSHSSPPYIQIDKVNKFYQGQAQAIHALKDISLEVPTGKILGIIGKSGAGKSSLLRIINGLESINDGHVYIDDNNVASLNQAQLRQLRQGIGMIFQHFNLLSSKTVQDNVALPLKVAKVSQADINKRVAQVLEMVRLSDKALMYPSQLSGGQKQRVGIARALVNEPKILLCDEATSALDPESTQLILQLLKQINKKLGITIVLITHEMQVIRDICDQVIVINQGQIVETGPVWKVFASPMHTMTQELLGYNQSSIDLGEDKLTDKHNATHTLLNLRYVAPVKSAPDLKAIFAQFEAPVSLYQSQVDTIQGYLVGNIVVGVATTGLDVAQLAHRLGNQILHVELIGYA
ncbi:ATP-binding cassette domain-containing protein [Moraxella sp. PS-22]|uniref:Cell division ATP-binding protein FtsE n=1 Tax=Moraxella tetraodonis TaxID=2767221 RepID=A0A9X1USL1_9GAMM|nr:ATP-binding cassette domain-containing protein [Moraxella tetraodonis]MCG8148302.1 ATP-binding cassette domain-containing protein [Moraxella tetraodonis]